MQSQQKIATHTSAEDKRFYTVPQAARASGMPKHKLRRAIKLKLIPSSGMMDGRQYVRLSDINRAMASDASVEIEVAQDGGAK